MTNEEMRSESGNAEYNDKLTCFMYLLLRNKMSSGDFEELVVEVEKTQWRTKYTNGWLANYSKFLSNRLLK